MKGYVVGLGKKDVVKQRDSEELTRLLESPGEIHICGARLKLAGGMVVSNDQSTCPDQESTLKDFTSVNGG